MPATLRVCFPNANESGTVTAIQIARAKQEVLLACDQRYAFKRTLAIPAL